MSSQSPRWDLGLAGSAGTLAGELPGAPEGGPRVQGSMREIFGTILSRPTRERELHGALTSGDLQSTEIAEETDYTFNPRLCLGPEVEPFRPMSARELVSAPTLETFFRRYNDGRQPIHLVKAFENTKGFW